MFKILVLFIVFCASGALSQEEEVSSTTERHQQDDPVPFGMYTCPTSRASCRRKRGIFGLLFAILLGVGAGTAIASTPRWLGAEYGIKHAYVQVGDSCYDYGGWNYPRKNNCSSSTVSCCTSVGELRYSGTTNCSSRIGEFQAAWRATGYSYTINNWHCQTYTAALKNFLRNCPANAAAAI